MSQTSLCLEFHFVSFDDPPFQGVAHLGRDRVGNILVGAVAPSPAGHGQKVAFVPFDHFHATHHEGIVERHINKAFKPIFISQGDPDFCNLQSRLPLVHGYYQSRT